MMLLPSGRPNVLSILWEAGDYCLMRGTHPDPRPSTSTCTRTWFINVLSRAIDYLCNTETANKDGTRLREISSCCCLTTAGKTGQLLLKRNYIPFLASLYLSPSWQKYHCPCYSLSNPKINRWTSQVYEWGARFLCRSPSRSPYPSVLSLCPISNFVWSDIRSCSLSLLLQRSMKANGYHLLTFYQII